MLNRIKHYSKKVYALGPKKSFYVSYNRIEDFVLYHYWKQRVEQNKAACSWDDLTNKYQLTDCSHFFECIHAYLAQLNNHFAIAADKKEIIAQAEQYCNNGFNLLGSGLLFFDTMPWHADFRLKKQNHNADCSFDSNSFYKDIKIDYGKDHLIKDVKVPWELSRFQHAPILGLAFRHSGDLKYAQTFVDHFTDWNDKNPYLQGINWICPMEVAIRALNLIIALSFFYNAPSITSSFWKSLICSLYDHLRYLKYNWEVYDFCTSNHYLSNLIGYLYLVFLFQNVPGFKKKRDWCFQELLKECDKQIFDEGTDYEGSTCYHQLITELFGHVNLLSSFFDVQLPDMFTQKLNRMIDFVGWCTPNGGNLVQIGDNDSGSLVHPLLAKKIVEKNGDQKQKNNVAHYKQFGLSVIKTDRWHVSVRHHSYQKKQPSGHMHNDAGSITVALDGIPLFIDPGSFVYTPSVTWRNHFRSVTAHNTFFIKDHEPVALDDQLFFLNLPEEQMREQSVTLQDGIKIITEHSLYACYGLRAQRELFLDKQEKCLIITDTWHSDSNKKQLLSCWNFTLDPSIEVRKENTGILLLHDNKPVMCVESGDLDFKMYDAWVSFEYGQKIKSKRLYARIPLIPNKKIIIRCFWSHTK